MKEEYYFERLKESNYKLTPKRKAVIDLLLTNRRYFTIQELKDELNNQFDKLGIPTLYRIMQQFDEINIVNSIITNDNRIAYYLCDLNTMKHHHFICTKCKGVFCLEFCAEKQITEAVETQLSGVFLQHDLTIKGICKGCKKEKK